MPPRLPLSVLVALLVALAVAAPASASSVAYIDGHNLWYSSPDGARKVQVTSGGTEDASWQVPSMGRDGKTVVVHRDTFEGGSKRPVLYLYGADGKLVTANVMPVYSGAIGGAVYPIGLDMDWNSNAVAYGYQYCGFACQSLYRGYWLTFSDNQGAYPTNPQGASDAFNPTFYGTRVVSSDSGGDIFVQPDVPEAPFTSSYQGWLIHATGFYLSRVEVSPANNQLSIEWLQDGGGKGISIAQHGGTVPSELVAGCDLPDGGQPDRPDVLARRRPDGLARRRGHQGRGRAEPCRGHRRVHAQRPGARDLRHRHAAVLRRRRRQRRQRRSAARRAAACPAAASASGSGGGTKAITVALSGKRTRAAFAKGLTLKVTAAKAGRIDALRLDPRQGGARSSASAAGRRAARIARKGFAAASTTVVARGNAKAKRAGVVKLRLKPTKAAKRAAKRMRKVVLTIKVSQAGAAGKAKVRLK